MGAGAIEENTRTLRKEVLEMWESQGAPEALPGRAPKRRRRSSA